MNISPNNIVLNSYGTKPIDVQNRMLTVGGNSICEFLGIVPGSVRKKVFNAETLGVWTITPTSIVAGTTYTIEVTQIFPNATGANPKVKTRTLGVEIPAGGYTATQLCDAFRAQYFTGGLNQFAITASGTSTLILTANAGTPIIIVRFVNTGSGAAGDVVQTTAGVAAFGSAATLIANGVPASQATGTQYTLYSLEYSTKTGKSNSQDVSQSDRVWIWLNEADSDYATAITNTDRVLGGLNTAGTAADPEMLAVN